MSASVVTIRDIAADTGLSVTTVSLVLSGKADSRGIAHATRRRVQEAAGRMGYRSNSHARALRTGRSNVIGVLGVNLENPIPLLAMRQTARAVLERGYGVSLHDLAWQPDAPESLLDYLDPRRVAGLLLLTPRRFAPAMAQLARAARQGLPIVALDDCEVPGVDVVVVDREAGAYQATRHLLELGHRRILLTVDPAATALPLRARIKGYRRAHAGSP
jgi:LacI family transcriptional regulator